LSAKGRLPVGSEKRQGHLLHPMLLLFRLPCRQGLLMDLRLRQAGLMDRIIVKRCRNCLRLLAQGSAAVLRRREESGSAP